MWVSDSYEDIAARARAQMGRGDMNNALENFERISRRLADLKPAVLDRRPQLRALNTMSMAQQASIHHFQGDFERALLLYHRLGEMMPERGTTWRQLAALAHIDMGQAERGLDELRAEAVAAPGSHDVWLTIGVECAGLGRLDEADENLRRALKNAGTPEARAQCHLALFDQYRELGRVEDALLAWNEAWRVAGKEPDVIFPVYQMMLENEQFDRALEYIDREPNSLRRGFYQGVLEAALGRSDEAEKRWKRVARMDVSKIEEGHEAWAEAALRVAAPAEQVIETLQRDWHAGAISSRGLILLAAAEIRSGHPDHAEFVLTAARNLGLQGRPRQDKLPQSSWALFDELVTDPETKRSLCHFFVGCDPDDGQVA